MADTRATAKVDVSFGLLSYARVFVCVCIVMDLVGNKCVLGMKCS